MIVLGADLIVLEGRKHCEKCGSTSREDLEGGDSYSLCCGEPVVWDCDERCGHQVTP